MANSINMDQEIIVSYSAFEDALSAFSNANAELGEVISEYSTMISGIEEGWEGTPAKEYIDSLRKKINDCSNAQKYLAKIQDVIDDIKTKYSTNETEINRKMSSELDPTNVFYDT